MKIQYLFYQVSAHRHLGRNLDILHSHSISELTWTVENGVECMLQVEVISNPEPNGQGRAISSRECAVEERIRWQEQPP